MTTERLILPVRRLVPELARLRELVAMLAALFASITHHRDTEIAWEDGEAVERPKTRR